MYSYIGKYEIVSLLGRGAMGEVYEGRDPIMQRSLAIKTVSPSLTEDPELIERFFLEARAAGSLSHPNIVTIYECGRQEGVPFIAMELLQGHDLRQLMSPEHALSFESKLDIVRQVCDGLDHAHQQGIVHRDMKPANVRVLPDGTVKILDFGIARLADAGRSQTQTGSLLGTVAYMSPEQCQSSRVDARSDIWSTGVILYELMAGIRPFGGEASFAIMQSIATSEPEPLARHLASVPPELEAILSSALAKSPQERYPSAGLMSQDLRSLQDAASAGTAAVPTLLAQSLPATSRIKALSADTATSSPGGDPSPGSEGGRLKVSHSGEPPQPPVTATPAKRRSSRVVWVGLALGLTAVIALGLVLYLPAATEEESPIPTLPEVVPVEESSQPPPSISPAEVVGEGELPNPALASNSSSAEGSAPDARAVRRLTALYHRVYYHPAHGPAFRRKAEELARQEGVSGSQSERIEASVRRNWEKAFPHFLKGMEHAGAGEYSAAIRDLEEARKWDRDSPLLLSNLAIAYLRAAQLDQAERAALQARELDPEHWFARYSLGVVFALGGRHSESIEELRSAIRCTEVDPSRSEADVIRYLKNDPDLAALRGSSDFQSLIGHEEEPESDAKRGH